MENTGAAERESDFLRFILVASDIQSTLLLKNLTRAQTNAISEICFNILHSEHIEQEVLVGLKRHANLIRRLGERNSGVDVRRRIIKERPQIILNIIRQVESMLPI